MLVIIIIIIPKAGTKYDVDDTSIETKYLIQTEYLFYWIKLEIILLVAPG